jgi:hypothetical protein
MMSTQTTPRTLDKNEVLDAWLSAVSSHLAVRRVEGRGQARPKRNRERERARREARLLFAEYYRDLAVGAARAA